MSDYHPEQYDSDEYDANIYNGIYQDNDLTNWDYDNYQPNNSFY